MPARKASDKSAEENSSAFKHLFSPALADRISRAVEACSPRFNRRQFKTRLKELPRLEMKARVHLIRDALAQELPGKYPENLRVLLRATETGELEGFALWPFTEYIQTFGLAHREISLKALAKLTPLFTAEWAVRPFLRDAPAQSLAFLKQCARNKNVHLRRWASEGSRPRLPWGERLNYFITHPQMTLPILELLKYDSELYVRKSVANHLNDISRDNPDIAIAVLRRWLKNAPSSQREKIEWITRHALRTLIKAGDPSALKLIGVRTEAAVKIHSFISGNTGLSLGDRYSFEFLLKSTAPRQEKLVVDYVIHYARANGKTSAKVFKLKTIQLAPGAEIRIASSHHFRDVTTRRHYPGPHRFEIQVNGRIVQSQALVLK